MEKYIYANIQPLYNTFSMNMQFPRSMITILPANLSALSRLEQAAGGYVNITFPVILSKVCNSGPNCAGPANNVTFSGGSVLGLVNTTVCGLVSGCCICILLSSTISCINNSPSSESCVVFAYKFISKTYLIY